MSETWDSLSTAYSGLYKMLCNLFIKANLFFTCNYFYCTCKMAKNAL